MNEMYILHLITRLFQYCTVSNTDVFYYLLNILYWVPFVENLNFFLNYLSLSMHISNIIIYQNKFVFFWLIVTITHHILYKLNFIKNFIGNCALS